MKPVILIFCLTWMLDPLFAQTKSKSVLIPAEINSVIRQLDNSFTKEARSELKQLPENQLAKVQGIYIFDVWNANDSTLFVKYFTSLGIDASSRKDRNYLSLLAYHRYLNSKTFDINRESARISRLKDSIQRVKDERYERLSQQDSIKGIYIPKDLAESVKHLDKTINESVRNDIRKCDPSDVIASYHMTAGLWMRNNWSLYDGSRLHKYLYGKGIDHPDGMSGVILKAYRQYLNDPQPDYEKIIRDHLPEFRKMKDLIAANERQLTYVTIDPVALAEFKKTGKIREILVNKY